MIGDQDSLPERLRWLVEEGCCITCDKQLCDIAADEIERLRAKNEFLTTENDEQADDIIRLLSEIGRLRAENENLRTAGAAMASLVADDHTVEQCLDDCPYPSALAIWIEQQPISHANNEDKLHTANNKIK